MPSFGPIKRAELIYFLRKAGFSGPRSGGRHEFMLKGKLKLAIPNPHQGDLSVGLLSRLLRQAGMTRDDWESL
jgi:predicted RNA binding protein YcfA (HicA-like mRNA interferase family)